MTMPERKPLSDQLATCLKVMLEAQGMSQADLARRMGLSPKHVNQMVQGKSGALAMFDYAAFTLGCRWHVTLAPEEASEPVTGLAVADSLAVGTIDTSVDTETIPLGADGGDHPGRGGSDAHD